MATCAQIGAEIDKLESAVFVTGKQTEDFAAAASYNVNVVLDLALAKSSLAAAESGLPNLRNAYNKLSDLIVEANISGCGQQADYASTLANEASRKIDIINNAISRARQGIKVQEDAAKAEEAAKKENNAGTGTPGTAGQGAGATPGASSPPTQIAAGASGATGAATASTAPGATGPKPVTPTGGATGASGATGSAAPAAGNAAPYSTDTNKGLSGAVDNAQSQANRQDAANYALEGDWRVRLALAPGAQYLYDLPDNQASGILAPLRATDGVIFPYTPNINITYAAQYEPAEVTHSNYKIWQYRNSSVDNVTITADFTAQDTHEANYLLAVIHFFRTVTKMFYGKDQDPKAGTPPPLCYLYGLGQFQFNMHPLLITNFTYVLPNDVDYIRATTNITTAPLVNKSSGNTPNDTNNPSNQRISSSPSSVSAGGVPNKPTYSTTSSGTVTPTYVPTKITVTIQAIPVVARNDISQSFSLKDYATGKLLVGKDRPGRGGVW